MENKMQQNMKLAMASIDTSTLERPQDLHRVDGENQWNDTEMGGNGIKK
jgi:hypothetical protein